MPSFFIKFESVIKVSSSTIFKDIIDTKYSKALKISTSFFKHDDSRRLNETFKFKYDQLEREF